MGENNNKSINTETGTTTTNVKSASSESAGSGRGRRGSTEKTGIPKLVMVDVPVEEQTAPPKKNKPGAGRPKGTTAVKKKTSGKKPDTTQLKILVLTLSGIVASRPGMEVWNMSPDEVEQIIEPLANILAKHNVGQATSEYADYIALVMACFVIFVPKYLIWKQSRPKKEKKKNDNPRPRPTNETTETGRSSEGNDTAVTNNGTTFSDQLYGLIPSII